jgi:hypothetical protein
MNIIAKQDGQATVARREPQNWHHGASVKLAAPQFGQFSVAACILVILPAKTRKNVRHARNLECSNLTRAATRGAALPALESAGKIRSIRNSL